MHRRQLIIVIAVVCSLIFTIAAHAQLPQIQSGLSYLIAAQHPDGTWETSTSPVETTAVTVAALETLKLLNQTAGASYTTGAAWLQGQTPLSVDTIADQIRVLSLTGNNIDALLPLIDPSNGAWGGDEGFLVNPLDTALALQSLKAANYADQTIINSALAYLTASQNADGGWGFIQGDVSNVFLTAIVSATLQQFPQMTSIATAVSKATTYLLARQNADGGFGSPSNVYETSLAFISLVGNGQTQDLPLQNAVNFIITNQSLSGSWNDDPYSTALAVKALYFSENRPSPPPPPPAAGKFTGTVIDATTLQGVSGVAVVLESSPLINTITNASGNFTLADVAPGSQNVVFSLTGYASKSVSATSVADATVSLGAVPMTSAYSTGTISGTILDPGGNPLAGVAIIVSGSWSGSAVTGADGTFSFSYVTPGDVTITASKTGYQSFSGTGRLYTRTTLSISPRLNVTPSQVATGTIVGRVVEAFSGFPIDHMPGEKGVTVTISGGISVEPNPDNGGYFTIQGLEPNTYQVTVGMSGYASKTYRLIITPGVTTDMGTIRLVMSAGTITLTGKVTDIATGLPIPAAEVMVAGSNLTARADFAGTYVIADINKPEFTVNAAASGYLGRSFFLYQGGGQGASWTQQLDIALTPLVTKGSLTGTVVDAATKQPLSGVVLALVSDPGVSVTTDSTGTFTFGAVLQGVQQVTLALGGYTPRTLTTAITAGEVNSVGAIPIATTGLSASIQGMVWDAVDNVPFAGVQIQTTGTAMLSAVTSADGTYSIDNVEPGTVTVTTATVPKQGYYTAAFTGQLEPGGILVFSPRLSTTPPAEGGVKSVTVRILSVATDTTSYPARTDAIISAPLENFGTAAVTVNVSAQIKDSAGNIMGTISPANPLVTLAPQSTSTVNMTWNTAQTIPGSYSINVRVLDPTDGSSSGSALAEKTSTLTIASSSALSGTISLTPPTLPANMQLPVAIKASILNSGNIPVTTDMQLEARLDGALVYQQVRAIAGLQVNNLLELDFGSFIPATADTYTITLKPAAPAIAALMSASIYVGPSATALILATPDQAAKGDTKVTGKVVLTGMGGLTGIAADLELSLPATTVMDSASLPPASTTVSGSDKIYLWNFSGLNANGSELIVNLTMQGLQPGEERKIAADATLSYKDSATGQTIKDTLSIPVVKGIDPFIASLAVDKTAYSANATVMINAAMTNVSSSAKSVTAKVLIEDSNGALVQEIASLPNLNFVPAPTIDTVASTTLFQTIILSGSKSADSSLLINGVEVAPLDSSALWKVKYVLQPGLNALTVVSRNAIEQESAPVAVNVTWRSPQALWHMDGDWTDTSGNGNHGTAVNGTNFSDTSKAGGKAANFDGNDDYVRILNNPSLDTMEQITLHAWIKTPNPGKRYQTVLSKNYQYKFGFIDTWRVFVFQVAINSERNIIGLLSTQTLSSDWHHVVCTYDGAKLRMYIDGKLDSETAYAGKIFSHNYDVLIGQQANDCSPKPGCAGGNYYFQGLIDEVSIYNRALSADEIKTLYEASYKVSTTVNSVPPVSQALNGLSWNTGATTAGDYRARIILTENQKTVAEATAGFSILPESRVSSKLTTDKVAYNPNEQVAISASVTNLSVNATLRNASTRITVSAPEPAGGLIYTESKAISALLPGTAGTNRIFWNTGVYPPGSYLLKLQVLDVAGSVLSSATCNLTISSATKPTALLKGKLALDRQSILSGEPITASYSVSNVGNVDINTINIAIQTINSADQTVVNTFATQTALAMGASNANSGQINTMNYSARDYLVVLRASIDGVEETLAGTYFRVEGAPSAPVLAAPLAGSDVRTFTPAVSVSNAADPNSDRLSYQFELYLDSDLTKAVASAAVTETATSTSWTVPLPLTEDQFYYWRARAYDGKLYGTWMTTASFRVNTVDNPPLLTVSTLTDGTYTSNGTLNISGTVFDDSDSFELKINDVAVPVSNDGSFSYALLLNGGANRITTMATDVANNKTMDSRIIHFDQNAPALTIDTPADNSKTAVSPIEVKGSVDETSTVTVKVKENVQTAAMSGTAFSVTVTPEPGWNTIEIIATDLAGNPGSQKRSVLFDDQKPSLEITGPDQDIRTNKSSMTISGKATDPYSSVGVTVTIDGVILTPPVVNDNFSQIVTFADEKLYPITVIASNEVGTQTSAQRNVIFDKTPPNLTIDPVVTPTNAASQTVSGTREDGRVVTVSCPTSTVSAVDYPTITTWRAAISGLAQGENRLQAETTDPAGNRTVATATILYVPKAPEVTISASPNLIWTPNKKLVPVMIVGSVISFGSDIKDVTISVADEYGKYNIQGLRFGDTVLLEAWREGNDMDGRVYTITAVVTDQAGNRITRSTTVIVPHEMGK